ncbi:glyoxylate/hydroxypyruvate reductase A [Acetobacteraceae bacterium KSS8]|uniref:Glyoxylate/hydroxypyruvate reductase A n=1 Tax=Endosaccharibacter trunci TaxID=2812733 RepID=A0ABT1W7I7_9PROT|nr:glyoxylate/hydroxypyruvate reductase A [Acetobacteraceae bacterium KSS8]
MSFLCKTTPERGLVWQARFAERLPDLPFRLWPDPKMAETRFLAAWTIPDALPQLMPGLEVLFSIGAGIDQLGLAAVPPSIRVVRMIEPGLVAGMVEYVAWAVLSQHRELFRYEADQRAGLWNPAPNRAPGECRVGIMGTGTLGGACLRHLAALGFACRSWSRRPSEIEGVQGFSGPEDLDAFLAGTDILVCLLPLTDDTRHILDRRCFSRLPAGACVVNCGRGGHLVARDLIDALDSGQLSQAVLDVTEPEPLPPGHPFWRHPRIRLTPHIASDSQPQSGADAVIENIRRYESGQPMIGEVDRRLGY